ncbi:MAG: orotate phosphoribosyltransferase, partial [Bacteroidales bacterium]|nr:orotate phosphoribosyltransferase [Bacteroidales bacterium]
AYVRSAKKGHGLENLIEGRTEPGQSVVVVEDLISTGKSSLAAVRALRDAGCNVKGMAAIFTYGLKKADLNFGNEKCRLVTLTDYDTLVNKALEEDYIYEKDMVAIRNWKESPETWNKV